jgi:hypothetical protein
METLLFLLFVVGMFYFARNLDKILGWMEVSFDQERASVTVAVTPEPVLAWQITKCSQECVAANRSGVCECDVLQLGAAVLKGQVPSDWSGRPLEMIDLVDKSNFALRDTVFVMWSICTRGLAGPPIRFVAATYLPGSDESNAEIARALAKISTVQPFTLDYKAGEIAPSCSLEWMLFAAAHEWPEAD